MNKLSLAAASVTFMIAVEFVVDEYERVREMQNSIRIIDAPQVNGQYAVLKQSQRHM